MPSPMMVAVPLVVAVPTVAVLKVASAAQRTPVWWADGVPTQANGLRRCLAPLISNTGGAREAAAAVTRQHFHRLAGQRMQRRLTRPLPPLGHSHGRASHGVPTSPRAHAAPRATVRSYALRSTRGHIKGTHSTQAHNPPRPPRTDRMYSCRPRPRLTGITRGGYATRRGASAAPRPMAGWIRRRGRRGWSARRPWPTRA